MTGLIAGRAEGRLRAFNEAGVITPADVHVAQRLGVLAGESDERVLLAVALTVRGTRHGSVVLDLATAADTITPDIDEDLDAAASVVLDWPERDGWISACAASPLVTGAAGGPPLQMVRTRLWLDRYWRQEEQAARDLLARSADRPRDVDPVALRADLDELFPAVGDADQRLAVAIAALSRVSVIAGGPGTGKTTTVARLVAVFRRRLGDDTRIALAAFTGKAAARLEEAIHEAGEPLRPDDRAALRLLTASTLHRLLGRRPGVSSRFRHDRDNHLPYDVVVVDESSMVSLTMMARLLEALPPHARLVLVGDPDQLTSVEAGAVLGDLVDQDDVGPVTEALHGLLTTANGPANRGAVDSELRSGALSEPSSAIVPSHSSASLRSKSRSAALRESVALLRTVRRFDESGAIAELADLVRHGRSEQAVALLRSGAEGLEFHEVADDEAVSGDALATVQQYAIAHELSVITAAEDGDVVAALTALDRHRLLCAHRGGPRGVRYWTDAVERWLTSEGRLALRADGRYAGQPLMVARNDYEVGLFNGDSGVVIRRGDDLVAAFRRGGTPVEIPLVRLADVRPMHASTVHRAQGSQFDAVTVLLPAATSPLATRQTFYTAVTRAARHVRLVGSADAVTASIEREAARATGLRARLDAPLRPISARD